MNIEDNLDNLTGLELEEERKKIQERLERIARFERYDGPDRVVRLSEAIDEIKKQPEPRGYSTGFGGLDDLVSGIEEGELVVVTGHTGTGKTTLLQSITANLTKQGTLPLWFSYEVGLRSLIKRFSGDIPEFCLPRMIEEGSVDWLKSKVIEAKVKYKTDIVFIDHLHYLLDMDELGARNPSLYIGHIMRSLKKFAVAESIIIFLVSHIKKVSSSQEPELSDLRDSSFTGQEADQVWSVFREQDITEWGVASDKTYLTVLKNRREGNHGKIELIYRNGRYYEKGGSDYGESK